MHILRAHFIFELATLIADLIKVILKDAFAHLDVFLAALHHLCTLQMELWPWERHPPCWLFVLHQCFMANGLFNRLLLIELVQLISRKCLLIKAAVSQRRHLEVWTMPASQIFLPNYPSVRPGDHLSNFLHLSSLFIHKCHILTAST